MWILFIAAAAICNSVMDSVENEHIAVTDFANDNPNFWNKRISWQTAKQFFGWKLDAWHVFKSAMILLHCGAMISYYYFPLFRTEMYWHSKFALIVDIIIYGIAWNFPFNLFYNRIFRK